MEQVIFKDLGKIAYKEAWDYQTVLQQEIIGIKIKNRDLPPEKQLPTKHYFLLCEHPPVYTLGKSGSPRNLLLSESEREEKSIDFYKINRGGDITFHGPGQIVGYPIFDLDCFFTDIHKFVRYVEEAAIRTLADYGIPGGRIPGLSGVWLNFERPELAKKICAVGIHLSRWVTMHGFAFNVHTNLDYFSYIIPCGIQDKGVTSLSNELGRPVAIQEVKNSLKKHYSTLFEIQFI